MLSISRFKLSCVVCFFILSACGEDEKLQQDIDVQVNKTTEVSRINNSVSQLSSSEIKQVYFGDTHLHTSYSFDAGMVGDKLDPDAAYRFAKGEEVIASMGAKAKILRPLDFLVIADHAESLGIAPLIAEHSPLVLNDPAGKELYDLAQGDDVIAPYLRFSTLRATTGKPPMHRDDVRGPMWQRIVKAADKHNQPGHFTAFIGYEYTSAIKTNNLHRVVVYRDGKEKAGSMLPFSSVESVNPEDLWEYMHNYENQTGGQILAIPHNGNLSNGLMFDDFTFKGKALTADYAKKRMRWEPLYEVTQIKGDAETHPILSPDDEFADFYNWDKGNFGFAEKQADMLPREYARAALKRGLKYQQKIGVNPFKFGLIGASDSHTSLATVREDNFFSKASPAEPGTGDFRYIGPIIQKYPGRDVDVRVYSYETAAAGLTAVWASDNTRETLFDAMKRKEVYATTGTRIRLQVFAGYDFTPTDSTVKTLATVGYKKGVPMGGDLSASAIAPQFLIRALKDPDGANLERIQIVKGWLDADGELQEKVYDVEKSRNDSFEGSPELNSYWQDPDFDKNQSAFYYVRVLEIETPSWLAFDKEKYGDQVSIPVDAKMSLQERAYSSPIWYKPK